MADIEGLVRALGEGDDAAKAAAARALWILAYNDDANRVLIAEAGGIPPLVQLVRDGSAEAKLKAARALVQVAYNDANSVEIAEAGGIAPLVELVRDGSAEANYRAAWALRNLAYNNDANAVAIAAAVGFDALVQLARGGRVTVHNESIVRDAGVPAKRKAALAAAELLCDYVPEFKSVPGVLMAAIVSYL